MLYALQYLKENSNDLTIPSEKALWEGKNSILNRTMSTLEEPGKQRVRLWEERQDRRTLLVTLLGSYFRYFSQLHLISEGHKTCIPKTRKSFLKFKSLYVSPVCYTSFTFFAFTNSFTEPSLLVIMLLIWAQRPCWNRITPMNCMLKMDVVTVTTELSFFTIVILVFWNWT